MIKNLTDFFKIELNGLYGEKVLQDIGELIRLYEFYDGFGQNWTTPEGLDYAPSKLITNLCKKLIKREARFMFGRTPELKIVSGEEISAQLQKTLDHVLQNSYFPERLLKGARDCFIGKRVAIKLTGGIDTPITVQFRPSMEFIFTTQDDDIDKLQKIIFFYSTNDDARPSEQRIWKQKYEMSCGRCFLTEGVYNGYGNLIEGGETKNTGLSFIPCRVIINDGLTGDICGESDVAEIMGSQMAYNRLKSDDLDALKFNMFPQRVAVDADGSSLENMKIAPGALVDLVTEPARSDDGAQAKLEMLESSFSYSERFESAMNRIKNDAYEILGVPNLSLEQLKGLMQSGKSMKALYWEFIERCEEKWTVWEPSLKWMCRSILEMAHIYHNAPKPPDNFDIHVEHLYPILEDDESERITDMQEVTTQVRSRKSYIEKWGISPDADEELQQIKLEQTLLQDSFDLALDDELSNSAPIGFGTTTDGDGDAD